MDDYRVNEENQFEYNGFDEGDRNPRPKRRRIGLRITAVVLAISLLVSGIGYAAYRIGGRVSDKKTAAAEINVETENAVRNTAAHTSRDNTAQLTKSDRAEKSDSEVTLTKHGTVDEADTDATPTVLDVSEVVENVMPCVVAITDNLEVTSKSTYNPYNYYFGGNSSPSTKESAASGSGVIIAQNDEELLIVTNNHVVDNEGNYSYYSVSSTGLTVKFIDESTADAVVKGTDSEADLAVIAVKLSDLSEETMDAIRIAVCGDSDALKVGTGVIAIGNAMGYGQSVTTGIVSAKNRDVTIDGITRSLMQTDAAINPGNSGGGLFNSKGELIGINSAKSVDTSVEGMGFAIPINSASEIIEDLMNREVIPEGEQGYLGINGETVPDSYVEQYDYPKGVSVTRIGEGSPAEEAGLQIYDIITAVNGKEVETMNALKATVNGYPAGTTVTVSVSRPDGRSFKELEFDVTLATYDEIMGKQGGTDEQEKTEAPETEDSSEDSGDDWGDWEPDEDSGIDSFFDWLLDHLK